jgi:hypothetical protein
MPVLTTTPSAAAAAADSIIEERRPGWTAGDGRRVMALLPLASILVAAMVAWNCRFHTNADGLSYLEMGANAVRGDWRGLLIPNWSPLYPALVSLVLAVFRPSLAWEIPAVHVLNWVIFVFAAGCFRFFLGNWFRLRGVGRSEGFAIKAAFAYALFTGTGLTLMRLMTPDLLVAAFAYLAAGLCSKLSLEGATWRRYALLGAALGAGYYAKAPFIPLSVVLLALLTLFPPAGGRRRLVATAGAFLAVVAPYVALLSFEQHRLTFGEAGRLNYAWYVNQAPYPWEGLPAGTGVPAHPPRVLRSQPLVFEFGYPLTATYPLWYNPTYWSEGLRTRIDFRQIAANSGRQLLLYARWFALSGPLWAGAAILWKVRRRRRARSAADARDRFLWIWPLAALLMYLVHVDFRYIAPFLVLLWLALYGRVWDGGMPRLRAAILAAAGCVTLIPPVMAIEWRGQTPEFLEAARGLNRLGIGGGSAIAVAGSAFDAFYARAAGVRIVAQVCDADRFWDFHPSDPLGRCESGFLERMSPAEQSALWQDLRAAGVRAAVVVGQPSGGAGAGWRALGRSQLAARLLD